MTKRTAILTAVLLSLAACSRHLPPSTGSIVPQPIADTLSGSCNSVIGDDGDNCDDDFAN